MGIRGLCAYRLWYLRRMVRFVQLSLLLCLSACGDRSVAILRSADATVRLGTSPFALTISSKDGTTLLDTSGVDQRLAGTDRPTFVQHIVPGWDGYQAGPMEWASLQKAELVEVADSHARARLTLDSGEVMMLEVSVDGRRVRIVQRLETAEADFRKIGLSFALPDDEHFFGLGERFGTFDHRGWSLYSWAEEGPLGAGEGVAAGSTNPYPNGPSMTYFPVPFFHSSRGYAVHLDTTFRSETSFGSPNDPALRLLVDATTAAFTVYVTPEPLVAIDDFTADTGRPIVPAPWVFGPRRRIDGNDTIDGKPEWQVMRERKLPLTGIDDATHFLPDLDHVGREAELTRWTSTLHAAGFKVMAYNNPYVAQNAPRAAQDYQHGLEKGFFALERPGAPALVFLISGDPLNVAQVDFTSRAATSWFQSLLSRSLELGYDGWMHDFGEYIPRGARFSDGRRGTELHNLYPVLSAKAARELLQEKRPDDHLFFVRSGFAGSQAFVPAVWGGDAETSFDETQGIPSTIRSGLSLSMSGVPYWGSDGGGFKCLSDAPRDKEVYLRWLAIQAVSPIMMDQNACSNPLGRRTKWTLFGDAETQEVYRRLAGFHTRLQPYFLVLAQEAHARGTPLMRAPMLLFPKNPRAWAVDDAFFLGPALYAAPVVRRGQRERAVWLPPSAGRYLELERFKLHAPDSEVTVPAPLDRLPLFLVEGQLLPLLDAEVQTLVPAQDPNVVSSVTRADVLDVQVALAPGGRASLTLADGTILAAARSGGAPTPLTTVPSVVSCERCTRSSRLGDVEVVEVAGARASADEQRVGDLSVSSNGQSVRRVRWQVFLLPADAGR